MESQVIVTTPSQLRTLVIEAVSFALKDTELPAIPILDTVSWLSIQELRDYLPGKPAITTLYGKVQRREIPFKRMGKRLVFLRSEIDQWLSGQHRKTNVEISVAAEKYLSSTKKRA